MRSKISGRRLAIRAVRRFGSRLLLGKGSTVLPFGGLPPPSHGGLVVLAKRTQVLAPVSLPPAHVTFPRSPSTLFSFRVSFSFSLASEVFFPGDSLRGGHAPCLVV